MLAKRPAEGFELAAKEDEMEVFTAALNSNGSIEENRKVAVYYEGKGDALRAGEFWFSSTTTYLSHSIPSISATPKHADVGAGVGAGVAVGDGVAVGAGVAPRKLRRSILNSETPKLSSVHPLFALEVTLTLSWFAVCSTSSARSK